jgi:hypothetical protein
MEFEFKDRKIKLQKEFNELDNFTLRFTELLNRGKIKYVVVSGYVAIMFGRNRNSEDIDIITEHLSWEKFSNLWDSVIKDFDCIITPDKRDAYESYLSQKLSLRFSNKRQFIPNIEMKFEKNPLDSWSLDNRVEVAMNGNSIFISPMELQIAFKLFLGAEKDIEDAKHLYNIFADKLDRELFEGFLAKLDKDDKFNKYLRRKNEGS